MWSLSDACSHLRKGSSELAGKAVVAKVDTDAEQSLAAQYEVMSLPTLILFKDAKEVDKIVGLRSFEAIRDWVLKQTGK